MAKGQPSRRFIVPAGTILADGRIVRETRTFEGRGEGSAAQKDARKQAAAVFGVSGNSLQRSTAAFRRSPDAAAAGVRGVVGGRLPKLRNRSAFSKKTKGDPKGAGYYSVRMKHGEPAGQAIAERVRAAEKRHPGKRLQIKAYGETVLDDPSPSKKSVKKGWRTVGAPFDAGDFARAYPEGLADAIEAVGLDPEGVTRFDVIVLD